MTIRTARALLRQRQRELAKAVRRGRHIWFNTSIWFDRFDFFWHDHRGELQSVDFSGDEMLGRVFTYHRAKYREEGSTWKRVPGSSRSDRP